MALCLVLSACADECEHTYYSDCDASCHMCGEDREVTAQHNRKSILDNKTCTDREGCEECGAIKGDYIEHTWTEATCTLPKTCTSCGDTEGEALGHTWVEAAGGPQKTCSVCKATEKEAQGND